MQEKRATIKDIAKATGVSNMAVSLALNNKSGVSETTRERILKAARELNYVPNQLAKSLLSNETKTLGVVNSSTTLYAFGGVWKGIEEAAEAAGYSIIVASTDEKLDREKATIEILLNKRVDGLILVAPVGVEEEDMAQIRSMGVPFIYLLRQNGRGMNACLNDNVEGGYKLMKYLLDTGSEKFLFISLPLELHSWQEREKGFRRAMEERGISYDRQRCIIMEKYDIEAGREAVRKELEKGLEADTIVCGCDLLAVGALKCLREAGISVPEHVRLTGYDGIELAEYLRVPLTTIRQPYFEIGRLGTQILLEQIRNPQCAPQQLILDNELIVRESTER